jgi:phenylpyruvate tautomerase PptA (4-oxalocrotonate tautomerase family)
MAVATAAQIGSADRFGRTARPSSGRRADVPLVRISVLKGRDPRLLTDIDDNFRVITEHEPGHLSYDPSYLQIERSDGIVIIQITLNEGRTVAMKQAFYAEVAPLLEPLGVRPPDVFINLVEVRKENWSFGHGLAQYA